MWPSLKLPKMVLKTAKDDIYGYISIYVYIEGTCSIY